MIKYPGIKKNAACANTQQYLGPQYTLKVTTPQCTSKSKNLHSSKYAHIILG
jgi:rRNA maturation protein Nop10